MDEEKDPQLEITPMIDVTFLLLIFFMCSIKFKQLEGKLDSYLPKDTGVTATNILEIPDEPIRVQLRVGGGKTKITVNGKTVANLTIPKAPQTTADEQQLKTLIPLDDLRVQVGTIHRQNPELKCIIDPDERVPNMHVIAALDACLAAGIENINFTIPPKKKAS
jgi:biopolymer transport protein ExbD